MAQYGPEEWWYPTGAPAANQPASVFLEDESTFASIFSDSGLTVPLANPTSTDASGLLSFYAADGTYWIFVGPDGTGDSVLVELGDSPPVTGAVESVNGQTGVVELDAADVGAQPIATINAKGDLYVGTANDATTRKGVGIDGTVLTALASDPTGMVWATPAPGGVTSVNGDTGVVVLTAADVGADPAGSAAAAQAAAIAASDPVGSAAAAAAASQPLATIDAAGDLYIGTGADATTRLPIGTDGEILTVVAGTASWEAAPAGGVTSVNGDTGVVVLDATDVGADPAGSAAAAQAASQPVDSDLTAIAALAATNDDIIQRKAGAWTNRTVAQYKTDLAYTASEVGAIATSFVNAKGDLISASANDTPTIVTAGANGTALIADSAQTSGLKWVVSSKTEVFSDDRNVLTVGTGLARMYNRFGSDMVIVGAWASVGVQPTGAAILVDVHLNGTTIYTTQGNRPTVAISTNGGGISATPDVTAWAQGDYLTVDIDQIGSTIPGGLLTVGIVVRYA